MQDTPLIGWHVSLFANSEAVEYKLKIRMPFFLSNEEDLNLLCARTLHCTKWTAWAAFHTTWVFGYKRITVLWFRRRVATSTTTRWSSGVASARSPGISDRRPRKVRGRRVLVILDRNPPMGRPRGVGLIANFNLPNYPRGPATLEFHPRRNSYGNKPLKRARSVCDAERFQSPSSVGPIISLPWPNSQLIPHMHDTPSQWRNDTTSWVHSTNRDIYLYKWWGNC